VEHDIKIKTSNAEIFTQPKAFEEIEGNKKLRKENK